jgi:hypothetical protein
MTTTGTDSPSHLHHGNDHHHGHDQIHFKVDGEPYTTFAEELTPNQIIREFAGKDPATHFLVQIHGHDRKSYEGVGEIPIRLHDGERFQVISTGPTPVSDGR